MIGGRSVRDRDIHREILWHEQSSRLLFPLHVRIGEWWADVAGKPFSVRFEDEGRFGRITRPAACWAPAGCRPVVPQQAIREYTYAYAAVAPFTGEIDSLVLPNMYASTLQIFLDTLSERHSDEYILLVMDGAPCHRAGVEKLTVPENIRLIIQPPYSPEVNPVEHLWDELREKFFCNCVFKDMDAVEDHLITALQWIESRPQEIQRLTCFPWMQCV